MIDEKPKIENVHAEVRFDRLEIYPGPTDFTVFVGANQKVTIDKLFGPLSASDVRVYLDYNDGRNPDWVVEYLNPSTELWEEKARWYCQENWPTNEDDEAEEDI